MLRSKFVKGIAAAIAIVALTTAAYATFSVYVSPGLQWKGQISWNSDSGSVVNVRVQNTTATAVHIIVDVKARALDGSTVSGSKTLQLAANGGREVSIALSKPITALQFTQIRTIP
jgi:hypothetical protein